MGRKKAFGAGAQQVLRPFCFYCERAFDDETVLLQHQRAKHFRCPECDDGAVRGKCESVQGLIVHTLKVHGKSLARVPNAMQGRENPEMNVYGMDGIPSDLLREKGYPDRSTTGTDKPVATPPATEPPPGMPPLPGVPPLHGMPGMPPLGMPPPPDGTSLASLAGVFPGGAAIGVPGMHAPTGGGPSLEGFQQFLAAQGVPPPGGLTPPGLQPPAGMQPPGMPPSPFGSLGGCSDSMALGCGAGTLAAPPALAAPAPPPPEKRPRLGDAALAGGADEDISVEERRAMLPRYCVGR